MNWTMGRYIDSLDDEGRDRLVTAEDFSEGSWWNGKCGCLIGTAQDFGNNDFGTWYFGNEDLQYISGTSKPSFLHSTAAYRYNLAVRRFGKARVVRAIKLRAAATTSRTVERASPVVHEEASK